MPVNSDATSGPLGSATIRSAGIRVLFVSPVADVKGGGERVLLELLSNPWLEPVLAVPVLGELSEAAAESHIPVTCYNPGALLSVHRPPRLGQISAAILDAIRCALRVHRIARGSKCDVIHANGLKAHALGAIVSLVFRDRVVMHLHDIPYRRSERIIWRVLGHYAARVIIVSRPCWPGRISKKVVVLQNGVRPWKVPLDEARPLDRPKLGFVGRYHPHKGMDLLLDWVAAAKSAGLDINVVLRGRPDVDHPDYWDRIRRRIHSEGLATYVVDQGWRQGAAVYDDIDFLVVSSNIPDPAPLVISEAMSAGVVVISYPSGGIPELMPTGTGALVRTSAEFVEALRGYIETPGLYDKTRRAAYDHVREAHNPELLARRFAAICEAASGKETVLS